MPDYIKGLSNPNREKYYDSLVKLQPEVNRLNILIILISFEDMDEASATYNAWEEDLATLNIFFGQETVMGESEDANQQINDMYKRLVFLMIPKQITCLRLILSRAGEKH